MHLETERLVLEEFTMDDLPALWDIFRDEQTMEHMAPMTRAGTEELLRSFCGRPRTPGCRYPGGIPARRRRGPGRRPSGFPQSRGRSWPHPQASRWYSGQVHFFHFNPLPQGRRRPVPPAHPVGAQQQPICL